MKEKSSQGKAKKINKIKVAAIVIAVVMATVFTACSDKDTSEQVTEDEGTDSQLQEEVESIDFPLEKMYEVNQAVNLAKKYGNIALRQKYIDADGTDFKTIDISIINDNGEYTGSETDVLYAGDESKYTFMDWSKGDDGYGYKYVLDKGIKAAFVYPKEDYIWGVIANWDSIMHYSGDKEWALSVEEDGDKMVVATRFESLDDGKFFDGTYTMDKESYELVSMERKYYTASGTESFDIVTDMYTQGEMNADDTDDMSGRGYKACVDGDICDYRLTLLIDPSGEEKEEHRFDIAQDCSVFLTVKGSNFEYFSDKELTKSVTVMSPKGSKVHYWAKCTDEENGTGNSYVEGLDKALVDAQGDE